MSLNTELSKRLAIAATLQKSSIPVVQHVGDAEVKAVSSEAVRGLSDHSLTREQFEALAESYLGSQIKPS